MFIHNLLRFFVIVGLAISMTPGQAANKKSKPQVDTPVPAVQKLTQTDVDAALNALESVLAAYTEGDYVKFDSLTDPLMIGRGVLTDLARQSYNKNKQIRITLLDTKHSPGEDVLFIQTNWIKHFLALPGMTGMQRRGKTTFVMTSSKEGWHLSAVSGDNIFRPE